MSLRDIYHHKNNPCIMDNNSRKYHLPIQFDSKRVMARIQIRVCVHSDLDLGDMTSSQGHDTTVDINYVKYYLDLSGK